MSKEINAKLAEMKRYFFDESTVLQFIDFLKNKADVIASHRKGDNSFSYEPVTDTKDVVLDYPRTIQPLKKFFLPPIETLLSFRVSKNAYKEEKVEVEHKIFFGIHSYEMQGIKRLDFSFERGKAESNYFNRRDKSLFIGISYTPDKFHFAKSVGIEIEQTDGFCLFLEKVQNGYLVFAITDDRLNVIRI